MTIEKLELPHSNPGIIEVTGHQYWFGEQDPKTFTGILTGVALIMTFIMIMMWLEPLDQYHTSESPLYSLIFTTVIGVLVLIGVLWARRWLMKKSPLVAMIDMQSQSFAVIEYYSGRIKGMKPCNELILYISACVPDSSSFN